MPESETTPGYTDIDRRQDASLVTYRLGKVEKQSEVNARQISDLARQVQTLVDTLPQAYVPRREHEQRRHEQEETRDARHRAVQAEQQLAIQHQQAQSARPMVWTAIGMLLLTALNILSQHLP